MKDKKTPKVCALIQEQFGDISDKELLVVGCGDGVEAVILSDLLKARVVGIDNMSRWVFDAEAMSRVTLKRGDATDMEFPDDSFDFVYCYHVLEHIPEPQRVVAEIARVLKPGGGYLIGTPNRHRLLGYIGSKRATFAQKVRRNWKEWKLRLRGRFRNEYGAHAGFTVHELASLIAPALPEPKEVTMRYYRHMHAKWRPALWLIDALGLNRVAYPGVYFVGVKPLD